MEIGTMKYCIPNYYGGSDDFIENCVDALRLATRTETAEVIQFERDDHMKPSSRDEKATIHETKRAA